jgi:hypothetical protein
MKLILILEKGVFQMLGFGAHFDATAVNLSI